MKLCPFCQKEVYDGAAFCIYCGRSLSTPAVPREMSRGKKFGMALLHGLLYLAVFLCVQFAVSFVHGFINAISVMIQYGDIPLEDLENILREIAMRDTHLMLLISSLLTILVLVLSFCVRHKKPLFEMHLRPVSFRRALLSFALGAALNVVVAVVLSMIPFPEELMESYSVNTEGLTLGPLWLQILTAVILVPIVEECIFRGLVFTRFRRGMPVLLAGLLSALLFGVVHGHIISVAYAFGLGILFVLLMGRSRDSILVTVLCHMGFNGANYLLGLLGESLNHPAFLLGLTFVCLAVCVSCLYFLLRRPDRSEEDEAAELPERVCADL